MLRAKKEALTKMNTKWQEDFRGRVDVFGNAFDKEKGKIISIKIRIKGGCFCRERHACYTYRIIDQQLKSYSSQNAQFAFKEHESGPELLIYVALSTAGITLAVSIIELITTIIKARSEGTKHGDDPYACLELIVREFDENGKIREEVVAKFQPPDPVDKGLIEKSLQKKINELLSRPDKKNKRD